jgi:hypothetical protein
LRGPWKPGTAKSTDNCVPRRSAVYFGGRREVDNGNSGLDILIGPDGPMKKNEKITTTEKR